MNLAIGADHAGFELKETLRARLAGAGHSVNDMGTDGEQSVDYPDFAVKVAQEVAAGRADFGILVCGSGIGMAIAANKVTGIRAATANDTDSARVSRAHNNANVLAIGARVVDAELAGQIVDAWLNTEFEGGRHSDRLAKIDALEAKTIGAV